MPTPLEWVARLVRDLDRQARHARRYDEHYSGERELDVVRRDYLEVFAAKEHALKPDFDPPRTNVAAVGVNAVAERLQIDGFGVDPSEGQLPAADLAAEDDDQAAGPDSAEAVIQEAARIWRRNDMDVMAPIAHVEALAKCTAFVLVGLDAQGLAVMTVEDPEQMVVARAPVPPYDVTAALKVYADDWTGDTYATLWLPDSIHRFRRSRGADGVREAALWVPSGATLAVGGQWVSRDAPDGAAQEDAPASIRGRVPVAELANRARLLRTPTSDLVDVAPLADTHSKLLADLVIAASFGAVPIRTATGITLPRDPVTGNPVSPFDVRADRAMVSENPDAKYGLLEAAHLAGYVAAIDLVKRDVRMITRVPAHYYGEGTSSGLSGETVKTSEGSLNRKIEGLHPRFGSGWRKGMAIALQAEGSRYAQAPLATRWANTETQVEAQAVDAGQKLQAMGVPLEVVLERIGFEPALVRRALALRDTEGARAEQVIAAITRSTTGAPPPVLDTPPAEPVGV